MDDIETRVVQMRFDNEQFESGINQTMKSLSSLNDSLKMKNASDGMNAVSKDSVKLAESMNTVSSTVEKVKMSFSALEIMGITALARLTNAAITAGVQMTNAIMQPIIQGGQRRALNIEAAKFQLEGLGVAWDSIKDDINYGVKDTAYGLDAAAKVASQLVASNVKVGDDMKSSLRAISGVAAMTNSQYEEIGHIFTTVASNGRLMTMQLRELSNRGLNASATLAKALNKTEAEINDMVSKGKIDFKTFADAMDDAFGSHAKEANKTFTGALSNVNAALSRIGAKFADPVFENWKNIFNAMIPAIDNVNNALTPVVNSFELISRYLGDNFAKLLQNEDFVMGLMNIIVDIYSYLKPIGIAILELTGLSPDIDGFAKSFRSFAEGMQLYGERAEKVKNVWKGIFQFIINIYKGVKALGTALEPVFKLALNGVAVILSIISSLSNAFVQLSPYINYFVNQLAILINTKLVSAINNLGNFVKLVATSIAYFVYALQNNISILSSTVNPFFNGIYKVCQFTISLFQDLFGAFTKLDFKVIGSIIGIITVIATAFLAVRKLIWVYQAINNFLNSVLAIGNVFKNIANIFKDVHLMMVSVRRQINVKTFADVLQNISILFLSIAATFKILSTIDWSKMTGSAGYLIGALVAFGAIYAAIVVTSVQLTKNMKGISGLIQNGQMLGVMGLLMSMFSRIATLFLSIAASFKILSTIDWNSMTGSTPYLIGALVSVITLISLISVASSSVNKVKPEVVNALRKTLGSIGILFIEIAASFKILSTIDWSSMSGSMAYFIIAMGNVLLVVSIISALAVSSNKVKPSVINALNRTLGSIGILFIEIAASFKILSTIDWSSMNGSIGYLLLALGSIILIFGSIAALSTSSLKVKPSVINALNRTISSIGILFIEIAASFKILSTIDWSSMNGSIGYLLLALGSIILIFGSISALSISSVKVKPQIVSALRKTLSTIGLLFIEIAASFKILSTIDWSSMNGSIGYLLLALGSIILIFGSIAAISTVKVDKKAINELRKSLATIGILFIEIAASFKILSTIDWSSMNGSIGYLLVALGSVILIFGSIAAISTIKVDKKAINELRKSLSSIGILFLEISVAFKILSTIDWSSMNGSIGYLLVALGSVVLIFGSIAALSKMSIDTAAVDSLRKVLGTIGILFLEMSVAFKILSTIDWSSFNGSAGYLIAAVGAVAGLLAILAIMTQLADSGSIAIAAISTLGTISLLFMSLALTFNMLADVNWEAIDKARGYLIGAVATLGVVLGITVALAAIGPMSAVAALAIAAISGLFLSLGVMFQLIGSSVNLIGDGVQKISDAINTIMNIPWDRTKEVIFGLSELIGGLVICMHQLSLMDIGGALSFAAITTLVAFSINQMAGINPDTINQVADGIVQFFTRISEALTGKEEIISLLTNFAAVLPIVSSSIMQAVINFAIGGLGLVAFAGELVIFAKLISLAGGSIGPAFQVLVDSLMQAGAAVGSNASILLASMIELMAFGVLLSATGALLIAGGGLMSVGAGLIVLSGTLLGTGMEILVSALMTSGQLILDNVGSLLISLTALTAFSLGLIPVGIAMIAGGATFTIGAGLIALAGGLFLAGVASFTTSGSMLANASVQITDTFDEIIDNLSDALDSLEEFADDFESAGGNIVSGIINGISNGMSELSTISIDMASAVLDPFCEALGINSPAWEFIKAAGNVIAGFVQGISDGTPDVENSMQGLAQAAEDNFGVNLSDQGGFSIESFTDAITSGFQEVLPQIMNMFGLGGTGAGNMFGDGIVNGVDQGIRDMASHLSSAQQSILNNMSASGANDAAMQAAQRGMEDNNYIDLSRNYAGWNDRIDVGEYFKPASYSGGGGGSSYSPSSELASTISGSSGSGSGINDASKGAVSGSGNTITNSNNTYNNTFVQNNYSPEALSRSDIYTQTRAQLDSFYGFMREKNPAF